MDVDYWKQIEDLAQFTRLFLYSSLELDQPNESNLLSYNVDDSIQVILRFVDEVQPHHYPTPFTYDMDPRHGVNEIESQDDCYENQNINLDEPAPFKEIKDEHLFIPQQDNDDIFYRLNEFLCDYNKSRPMDRQINAVAVVRCFMDNILDFTDFKHLNRNLKPLGVKAGAVRKIWSFLNPTRKNENEQAIPIGAYIYIPSEYQYEGILPEDNNDEYILSEYEDEGIVSQDNDDEDNDEEYIDFEIGENLSVPSDWSDDE